MEVLTKGTASVWFARSAMLCTCRSAAKRRKLDDSSETHLNFQSGEGLCGTP